MKKHGMDFDAALVSQHGRDKPGILSYSRIPLSRRAWPCRSHLPVPPRVGFVQALERVAGAYPRALFYPLLMTKASLTRAATMDAGVDVEETRLSKLTALAHDETAEAFAEVQRLVLGLPRISCNSA